jgi:hypothetical protein
MIRVRQRASTLLAVATAGVAIVATSSCQAQTYPASQRAVVTQMVAFTEITLTYGRPVARGRALFGDTGVVKWDRLWHPGADSASRITFNHDLEIEGHTLKAGEYSFWLLPHEKSPWSFILSRDAHVFHTRYPGESRDALRIDIPPEHGAHMESLAFYFPSVQRDEAILRIHWGETIIPVRIKAPYTP